MVVYQYKYLLVKAILFHGTYHLSFQLPSAHHNQHRLLTGEQLSNEPSDEHYRSAT